MNQIKQIKKKEGVIYTEEDIVFSYQVHTHNYYEMTLYMPFDGVVSINERSFDMNTVTAALISPSDFHKIDVNSDNHAKFIKISFDGSILKHQPDASIILQNIPNDSFFAMAFREILKMSGDRDYLEMIINMIVYSMTKNGIRIAESNLSGAYKLAMNAVRIINESFSENISLQSVADDLGITSQYFSIIFKQGVGVGFSEYLIGIRLRRAAKFIADTDDSITEICYECGYQNFSHFLRSFKKKFGVTPLEYRKQHQKTR